MALSPTSSRGTSSGSSLAVTDGITSVNPTTVLDLTSGATVTDAGAGQANVSIAGGSSSLTPTATKSANYNATAGQYVPVNATATITLPSNPASGTQVGVENISAANTVTVAAGAGDSIDSGGTSVSLTTKRRAAIYVFRSSDRTWFGVTPLSDAVQTALAADASVVVSGTSLVTVATGTLDAIATAQPPAAAVPMNAKKITGLANGSSAQDAAAFGQIPTSASSIGGMLTATYDAANIAQQLLGTTATQTVTNKRVTKRSGTTASSATPTINTDNVDFYSITALAAAITSFTTNLSGTPTVGQTLWIAITDNGTARAITWGASFEASTVALPTTTVISTRLDVGFVWNDATSKWRCVAAV